MTAADKAGMVIVGAGECGARAALALREGGYDGPVTLIGAEPHAPYERPPLSKPSEADEAPQPRTIATKEALEAARIAWLGSAEAVAVDRAGRRVALSDGRSIPYDKLLLATGARPRRLPLAKGIGCAVYLRSFDDALDISARLRAGQRTAIIGGGFIGLELAALARKHGCPVSVIEAQPRILMRGVPAEIAEIIHAEHARNGVQVLTGQGIVAIEQAGTGATIRLADGQAVEADVVVVGVGAQPNTELAESAGLDIDNGIAVDTLLVTSDANIFAAGDCCSFPLAIYGGRRVRLESWRNAQEQGALAARNMLGAAEPHSAVPWFWSDQYDLGLQVAGLSDEGRSIVRRDLGEGAFIVFHLADDGRLVAASGIGPGNAVARDIRLAEMLIAKRAKPSPDVLASPQTKLKALLAA